MLLGDIKNSTGKENKVKQESSDKKDKKLVKVKDLVLPPALSSFRFKTFRHSNLILEGINIQGREGKARIIR